MREHSEVGGVRHQVLGRPEISDLELGIGRSGGKRHSPGALWLLRVVVRVTREARLLRGPDSFGQQSGAHFPLLFKAARARDLQIAAAVARFVPAQLVWLVGLAGTPEEIGVLILPGAASPVRAGRRGRRGLPGGRLCGRLRPYRGFLAFLPVVG